ncbi:MAG: methyltransferase domain-containing protein, partial [Nocardioides sp.]|nr:methyltransferase domain-containing protein [Nocardioides sp.]
PAEVPTVHAALPHLPFKDDSFDVVIANFVVNHIGDPRDGARELARVIRSGGRALATGWTNRSTAQRELFQSVLERAGATPPESDLLPPGLGFERSVDGLAGLFADAGLTILVGEEVDVVWRIAPDRFWSALEAGIGGIGKALLQQEPEVRKRMRAAYDDLSAELLDGGELVLPAPAVFVVAQN